MYRQSYSNDPNFDYEEDQIVSSAYCKKPPLKQTATTKTFAPSAYFERSEKVQFLLFSCEMNSQATTTRSTRAFPTCQLTQLEADREHLRILMTLTIKNRHLSAQATGRSKQYVHPDASAHESVTFPPQRSVTSYPLH